jgi:hypothetical protein
MKLLINNLTNKYSAIITKSFVLSLLILLANGKVKAQNELDVIRNSWIQYSDAPHSLYHFLAGEAFSLLDSRVGMVAKMQSKKTIDINSYEKDSPNSCSFHRVRRF